MQFAEKKYVLINTLDNMANTDYRQIDALSNSYQHLEQCLSEISLPEGASIEYPLDEEVRRKLQEIIIAQHDEEYKIFEYSDEIKKLWGTLIKKSLNCLRFFDTREPFQAVPDKRPHACGVSELEKYFNDYSDFETTLYGSSKYYRDHVMHVFRVWLIGINLLLKDNCCYLNKIVVEPGYDVNPYEKLSMWTLMALSHDLGYPLQKAMEVIEKTKTMMTSFVSNPMINMDLSFSGVQNSMNDFVLRFISSKMWEIDSNTRKTVEYSKESFAAHQQELKSMSDEDRMQAISRKRYVARLQPKYYFKLQKSLEHSQHGILSSLIIYKHLLYFLESDYSLNEDYMFDREDSRQYYIRREILRAIASHTCHDIYQNDMLRFSFMLILCDDAQEWGRKSISELYVRQANRYIYEGINCVLNGDLFECKFSDKYEVSTDSLKQVIESIKRMSNSYIKIFRDGQDTASRNFNFTRQVEIDVSGDNNTNYMFKLMVTTTGQTKIDITKTNRDPIDEHDLIKDMVNDIFKDKESNYDEGSKCLTVIL